MAPVTISRNSVYMRNFKCCKWTGKLLAGESELVNVGQFSSEFSLMRNPGIAFEFLTRIGIQWPKIYRIIYCTFKNLSLSIYHVSSIFHLFYLEFRFSNQKYVEITVHFQNFKCLMITLFWVAFVFFLALTNSWKSWGDRPILISDLDSATSSVIEHFFFCVTMSLKITAFVILLETVSESRF